MESLSLIELADELDKINVRLGIKGELHGFEEIVLKQASRNFREATNGVECPICHWAFIIQNPIPSENISCPQCESDLKIKLNIGLNNLNRKSKED